jgi:RNA polymerase sigma-54 factor
MTLPGNRPSFLNAPYPKATASVTPYAWIGGVNLLHLPPDLLSNELEKQCEGLPVEVRKPCSLDAGVQDADENIAYAPSMDEEIMCQLSLLKFPGNPSRVESYCHLLDNRGFLNSPIDEASGYLGIGADDFLRELRVVQDWIEPAGFFALDLADCLSIQLRRAGLAASDASFLLLEGRYELENGHLATFMKKYGWDGQRLDAALAALRRLDPHPGYAFSKNNLVIPEIEFASKERVTCRIIDENLPTLSIMAGPFDGWNPAALRKAANLMRGIAERKRVLLIVASSLADAQNAYLAGRDDFKQSLGLKDIADDTKLHVSTISRVLNAHWARSDKRGVFKLSSLLLRKVVSKQTKTSRVNYAYIEKVLRSASYEGLSDMKISKYLGIPRRTITYHRNRLGLPSSKRKTH